jgi:hypothetical protein
MRPLPAAARLTVALALIPLLAACTIAPITAEQIRSGAPAPALRTISTLNTPEAAVTHYIEGLAANDADQILAACAVAETASGFDFAAQIERLRAYVPVGSMAPAQHLFYTDINEAEQSWQCLRGARSLAYSLLSTEDLVSQPLYDLDATRVAQIQRDLDPARLAELQLLAIALPGPELMATERYKTNAAAQAAIYGADELTERVALLSFNGATYLAGFQFMRFGSTWKISRPSSAIAGTSALGNATPISPADFDALVGD